MVDRLHVAIFGRVQGVGFRAASERKAVSLDLHGWVRNCRDGRVEAEFEGSKESLIEMLEWCRKGPSLAAVISVEVTWETGPARYSRFQVTF